MANAFANNAVGKLAGLIIYALGPARKSSLRLTFAGSALAIIGAVAKGLGSDEKHALCCMHEDEYELEDNRHGTFAIKKWWMLALGIPTHLAAGFAVFSYVSASSTMASKGPSRI